MKVIVIDKKSKKWAKLDRAYMVKGKEFHLSLLNKEWQEYDISIAINNYFKYMITHETSWRNWLIYPDECPYELGYFFAGKWYKIQSRFILYHPKFGWLF